MARNRRSFGMIDKLPSGNFRARYTGPDQKRHQAPATFPTKTAAQLWLSEQQVLIASGKWQHPDDVRAHEEAAELAAAKTLTTLKEFSTGWLATRTTSKGTLLADRTRQEYERLLRAPGELKAGHPGGPLVDLLELPLPKITTSRLRQWQATQLATAKATQTARAYALLSSIMKTATLDKLISENPCTIRGASKSTTGKQVLPPTDAELETILATINPEYQALVLLGAVGGLRWGEATALRAKDVDVERDQDGEVKAVRINVERAVKWLKEGAVVGKTKSEAGVRNVAIFGDDAKVIAEHVHGKIGDALLFPAVKDPKGYLHGTTFHRHWAKARAAAGRDDLRFHALRHYAGTSYAQAGATVKETMARLGHSSTQAAMRYQHSGSRDDELAARLARRTTA